MTSPNLEDQRQAVLAALDRLGNFIDQDVAKHTVASFIAREALCGYFGCEGFHDMNEPKRRDAVKRVFQALVTCGILRDVEKT